MRKLMVFGAASAALLAGCASTGGQSSLSSEQLAECLQPNRRVTVEISGVTPKPAPKPPAKAPAKPQFSPVQLTAYVQGNNAFDPGSATLKEGGKKDLDTFVQTLAKKHIKVNAVVLSGHVDKLEAAKGMSNLDDERAKAVKAYLETRGVDRKTIFWEGKDAREPMAVTKFCS